MSELTRQVVEYAHQYDVSVEGELGVLAGIEDEVSSAVTHYTRPEEVEDFVKKTGVDSLAISIGTSHGANKFKPEQCTRNADGVLVPPPLRFDILEEVERRIPGFPIVLHGASSVPPDLVKIINTNGGKLKDAVGIPEDQLRRAAASAVCKVNIDSDGRLAMTAAVRKVFVDSPAEFDPRKYLGPARDAAQGPLQAQDRQRAGKREQGLRRTRPEEEPVSPPSGLIRGHSVDALRDNTNAVPAHADTALLFLPSAHRSPRQINANLDAGALRPTESAILSSHTQIPSYSISRSSCAVLVSCAWTYRSKPCGIPPSRAISDPWTMASMPRSFRTASAASASASFGKFFTRTTASSGCSGAIRFLLVPLLLECHENLRPQTLFQAFSTPVHAGSSSRYTSQPEKQ